MYYFKRGKKKNDRGYHGPTRVIVVENGKSGAPMVVWLNHAGTLVKATPEHYVLPHHSKPNHMT